jgi:hypothetical protein
MTDSSSSSLVRIPLKSQNQQVDNRSQAEIISQQAHDVQNHHQWNQHPEVIEELHRTWREAIKVTEQQAQEQRAIEAVATERQRREWVATNEATHSRIPSAAAQEDCRSPATQSPAIVAPEAPPTDIAATSEDQQQIDQRWRESDDARIQRGMLDDLIFGMEDNLVGEPQSSTVRSTALQDPVSPLRILPIQEHCRQMMRPYRPDVIDPPIQSQEDVWRRRIFGPTDSDHDSDIEMDNDGSDKTMEYDCEDQCLKSTPSPPSSCPDPFDTSEFLWGPKKTAVTSRGSNTDTADQRRRYLEAAETAYFRARKPFPTASAPAYARPPHTLRPPTIAPASAPTDLPSTSAMESGCVCNLQRDYQQRIFVLERRIDCNSHLHHARNCTCTRCRIGR